MCRALPRVARAIEAGVPRNALAQHHLDLKNEFYANVKERGQPTDAETRLRKPVVRLKKLRDKDKAELEQLQADVEGLARAINQLTLENRQLRGLLSAPAPAVRVLGVQHIPPQPADIEARRGGATEKATGQAAPRAGTNQ